MDLTEGVSVEMLGVVAAVVAAVTGVWLVWYEWKDQRHRQEEKAHRVVRYVSVNNAGITNSLGEDLKNVLIRVTGPAGMWIADARTARLEPGKNAQASWDMKLNMTSVSYAFTLGRTRWASVLGSEPARTSRKKLR